MFVSVSNFNFKEVSTDYDIGSFRIILTGKAWILKPSIGTIVF